MKQLITNSVYTFRFQISVNNRLSIRDCWKNLDDCTVSFQKSTLHDTQETTMTASGTRTISVNRRSAGIVDYTSVSRLRGTSRGTTMLRQCIEMTVIVKKIAACLCDRRRDASSCHPPRFFPFRNSTLRVTLTAVFSSYFIERSCKLTMSCDENCHSAVIRF